jgi:hypothetical protein
MKNSLDQLVCFTSVAVLLGCACVAYAEPQLYDTGPSEESSYVRFANATDNAITVTTKGGAKVELNSKADGRVSRFFVVKSGAKLPASIQSGSKKNTVDVTGKAWEYITIAVLPSGSSQMKIALVRETPTDFNAMKSSVALFNLDEKCLAAAMKGGVKSASIVEKVEPFTVQRHLVNPIKLSATLVCGSQVGGTTVDLSQLQAGERYSVFLLTLKNERQAFFVRDAN